MSDCCRVAVFATHPIHYQIQLFKRLARVPGIDVTMLFGCRFGLTQQVDHTFGVAHRWYDESILEGLKHRFLRNYSRMSLSTGFGVINPAIVPELVRGRYDVLIIQGYAGVTEWLAIAGAKCLASSVLFRGETTTWRHARGGHRWLRAAIMKVLKGTVDVFLPIGTCSRDFYQWYGVPDNRLVLAPYTVENEFFLTQARELRNRRGEVRKSLGLTPEMPVVLYVSKLIPRKRPLDLLRAFEGLRQPAALVLVGDGPLRSEVERYVAERSLANIHCVGFQRQELLPLFYAIADVFVLPSEYEPWGLVVNEAMCFSLPVVTTRGVAAAADLVVNGENGFVHDVGDIVAIRSALERLLGDPTRSREMGCRSQEIIRRWGPERAVDGICRAIGMTRRA